MKRYLATMPHNSVTPYYHGVVDIGDDGILAKCGTPVEDFGCYYLSADPLPTTEPALFELFLSLMED